MFNPIQFRFGSCQVLPERHEVLLDGKSSEISPNAFAVLVYLINNRHRVVRREELLQHVWRGRPVIDNVLSRTIMQSRKAIGDFGLEPSMIKTVQRIGYRFIADLDEASPRTFEQPSIPLSGHQLGNPEGPRVGLLPFKNQTGDPNFAWVELGLLSLVSRDLAADPRLQLASTASVLMCLDNLPSIALDQEKAERLMDVLKLSHVVSTSVSRIGSQFVLAFRSFDTKESDFQSTVSGAELTHLGKELAAEVKLTMFPLDSHGDVERTSDYFLNECFARGMQALDERHWTKSAKFFDVACTLDETSVDLRLQHAYALARIPSLDGYRRASELVSFAIDSGDGILQARASYVMAQAMAECDIDLPRARTIINEALELAPGRIGEEWRMRAHMLKFHLAFVARDYELCSEILDDAEKEGELLRNKLWTLLVANNRGALQAVQGDVAGSQITMDKVLSQGRAFGSRSVHLVALSNLVISEFALGMFDRYFERCVEFMKICGELHDRPYITFRQSIANLFIGACELRSTDTLQLWRGQLLGNLQAADNPVARAFDLFRDALVAQSNGKLCEASRLLVGARALVDDGRHYHEFAEFLPHLIATLLWQGRTDDAAFERKRFDAFPEFQHDRLIQPAIGYLDATITLQRGDIKGWERELRAGLAASVPSVWQSYMRFDLAWHYLASGREKLASEALADVEHWLDRHPAGLVVGALLAYRQGNIPLALKRHQEHVNIVGGADRTMFNVMQGVYCGSEGWSTLRPYLVPSSYWVAS